MKSQFKTLSYHSIFKIKKSIFKKRILNSKLSFVLLYDRSGCFIPNKRLDNRKCPQMA